VDHDRPVTDSNAAQRTFGWWDMWARPEDDPREQGGPVTGEGATLARYLRDRRLTFEMKCADLDAAQMAMRSVPPSDLSLLGLLRHLAGVEDYWFRQVMAGESTPHRFRSNAVAFGSAGEAAGANPAAVADAWAAWRAAVAYAERLVAGAPGMDVIGKSEEQPELREVMVHMIEEYARHNGHADLLRERIDGRVGQ
jgi:hypothetical protein